MQRCDPTGPWALAGSLGQGAGRCHDGAHETVAMKAMPLPGASPTGGKARFDLDF